MPRFLTGLEMLQPEPAPAPVSIDLPGAVPPAPYFSGEVRRPSGAVERWDNGVRVAAAAPVLVEACGCPAYRDDCPTCGHDTLRDWWQLDRPADLDDKPEDDQNPTSPYNRDPRYPNRMAA